MVKKKKKSANLKGRTHAFSMRGNSGKVFMSKNSKKTYYRHISDIFFSVVDVLGFLKCLPALGQLRQRGAVPGCRALGERCGAGLQPSL